MGRGKVIKKAISFNSPNESHFLGEARKRAFEEALEEYRLGQKLTKIEASDSEIIIAMVIKTIEAS